MSNSIPASIISAPLPSLTHPPLGGWTGPLNEARSREAAVTQAPKAAGRPATRPTPKRPTRLPVRRGGTTARAATAPKPVGLSLAELLAERRAHLQRGEHPQIFTVERLLAWQSAGANESRYHRQNIETPFTWGPRPDAMVPLEWPKLQPIALTVADLAALLAPSDGAIEMCTGDGRYFLRSPHAGEEVLQQRVGSYLEKENTFPAALSDAARRALFNAYVQTYIRDEGGNVMLAPHVASKGAILRPKLCIRADGGTVVVGRLQTAAVWSYDLTHKTLVERLPLPKDVFDLLRAHKLEYFDYPPDDAEPAALAAWREARYEPPTPTALQTLDLAQPAAGQDLALNIKYLLQPHLLARLEHCACALLPLEDALCLSTQMTGGTAVLLTDLLQHYVDHATQETSAIILTRALLDNCSVEHIRGIVARALLDYAERNNIIANLQQEDAPPRDLPDAPRWLATFIENLAQKPRAVPDGLDLPMLQLLTGQGREALRYAQVSAFAQAFPSSTTLQLLLLCPWDDATLPSKMKHVIQLSGSIATESLPEPTTARQMLTHALVYWANKDEIQGVARLALWFAHAPTGQAESQMDRQARDLTDRIRGRGLGDATAQRALAKAWLHHGLDAAAAQEFAATICNTAGAWHEILPLLLAKNAGNGAQSAGTFKTPAAVVLRAIQLVQSDQAAEASVILAGAIARFAQRLGHANHAADLTYFLGAVRALTQHAPAMLTQPLVAAWLQHLPEPPDMVCYARLKWDPTQVGTHLPHLKRALAHVPHAFINADVFDAATLLAEAIILAHQSAEEAAASRLERILDMTAVHGGRDFSAALFDFYIDHVATKLLDARRRTLALKWMRACSGDIRPILLYVAAVPDLRLGNFDLAIDRDTVISAVESCTLTRLVAWVENTPADPRVIPLLSIVEIIASWQGAVDDFDAITGAWKLLEETSQDACRKYFCSRKIGSTAMFLLHNAATPWARALFDATMGPEAASALLSDSDRTALLNSLSARQLLDVDAFNAKLLATAVIEAQWSVEDSNRWRRDARNKAFLVLAQLARAKCDYATAVLYSRCMVDPPREAHLLLASVHLGAFDEDNDPAHVCTAASELASYLRTGPSDTVKDWIAREWGRVLLLHAQPDDALVVATWFLSVAPILSLDDAFLQWCHSKPEVACAMMPILADNFTTQGRVELLASMCAIATQSRQDGFAKEVDAAIDALRTMEPQAVWTSVYQLAAINLELIIVVAHELRTYLQLSDKDYPGGLCLWEALSVKLTDAIDHNSKATTRSDRFNLVMFFDMEERACAEMTGEAVRRRHRPGIKRAPESKDYLTHLLPLCRNDRQRQVIRDRINKP